MATALKEAELWADVGTKVHSLDFWQQDGDEGPDTEGQPYPRVFSAYLIAAKHPDNHPSDSDQLGPICL